LIEKDLKKDDASSGRKNTSKELKIFLLKEMVTAKLGKRS
jgi:hypothetical protein